MSIFKNIHTKYKYASIVERFIYINVAIFIFVFVFKTFGFLFESNGNLIIDWFSLPATFSDFLTKPWTLITYGFLHASFIHILLNLIALYFIGNLFVQYFTPKQFVTFYVLGTIFGGLIFLLSYNFFPVLSKTASFSVLLGASAGISAIFIGIATYMPNYQLKIRFIGFVKLWYLAAIWVGLDIIQIPAGNAGGHLSHIGGALFGFWYVSNANTIKINIWSTVLSFLKTKQKPLKTVYRSKQKTTSTSRKNKDKHQQKIDIILDKISKSGYDTLTKEEKTFLFQQGKK